MAASIDNKANGIDDIAIIVAALIIVGYIEHKFSLVNKVEYVWYLILLVMLLAVLAFAGWAVYKKRNVLKPNKWDHMSGRQFEDQIVIWLKQCGYRQIRKTEYYDQGIDIIAAKSGVVLGIQVKRSNKPVGVNAVRAAVAGLKSYACSQAMVVTNATFTKAAIRLAESNDCKLTDGSGLIKDGR